MKQFPEPFILNFYHFAVWIPQETLKAADCISLNHCVLLLRNLFHIRSGVASNGEASLSHQCLIR